MTTEEKELLLKDLCSRLPYGVKVEIDGYYTHVLKGIDGDTISTDRGINYPLRLVKSYLRPMSSMTEEEENEWFGLNTGPLFEVVGEQHTRIEDLMLRAKSQYNPVDWLNANHFDYRGLIPMGLAIAVTEENNPYKE